MLRPDPLTPDEISVARSRIKTWPRASRVALTDLTEPEVEAIMLLVALLDIRPEGKT